MKPSIRFTISLLLCAIAAAIPCKQAGAADDRIVIQFKLGSAAIQVNGQSMNFQEKPFIANNTVLVPLDAIVKSFGAEADFKEQGKISLIYRDNSIDLSVGSTKAYVNQEEVELPAAPAVKNNTTMVPLRYIAEKFGAVVSYDAKTGAVSAVSEDDGALTDLSFLTNSIGKDRVGNSYYQWSISVPKSSRVAASSFNSKFVSIENEHRGINLEISVSLNENEKMKLSDYYAKINENPADFVDSDNLGSSSINTKNDPAYIELLYNDSYDEAVIQRIYMNSSFIYNVKLSSYNETNPEELKDNPYYAGILDSFKLGYKGGVKEIEDLSKVKYGMSTYENYITFDNSNRYFVWELNVLPEWDVLKSNTLSPLFTRLGPSISENISVEISKPGEKKTVEEYGEYISGIYGSAFNPKAYTFIQKGMTTVAGNRAFNLVYDIKLGDSTYTVSEYFIQAGNLFYDLAVKAPQDKYKDRKEIYGKMLETFKFTDKNIEQLEKDIDNYNYQQDRNRVGKNGSLSEYQNKPYKWSIKIPGQWIKSNSFSNDTLSFTDDAFGLGTTVQAVELNSQNKASEDKDRFIIMKYVADKDGVSLVSKETDTDKGTQVRVYNYRWESPEDEIYADIKFYVLDREKYSYCVFQIMPDLLKSDKNLKDMKDIWTSFNPEG
ncbi:MAG: stalk domain-containing protein [Clostridiales bacterium]|jgi:hypothetical protein|nr:copper amine oxidase N-terminal domain-containing protein [Eubacteriales bacterium]MDH7565129.1 stalk domain-containing protein [Clostridiales bacterium]